MVPVTSPARHTRERVTVFDGATVPFVTGRVNAEVWTGGGKLKEKREKLCYPEVHGCPNSTIIT